MARKSKIPGLRWDKTTGKGRIEKQIAGIGPIRRRFEAGSWSEAEDIYHRVIAEAKQQAAAPKYLTWREAATKYLLEETKRSLDRDATCLQMLDPWIGTLTLDQIHQGTLQPYIDHRRRQGIKSGTVERDLAVVRRILILASRVWRDEQNRPWIPTAPLLRMPEWDDDAKPHPLSWEEQRRFFQRLPDHLAEMALFAVNTGARESLVCGLRWEWEVRIPELGTSVFVVPGKWVESGEVRRTKNGTDCLIPLNATARGVIESRRGQHPEYVFTYRDRPVERINNSGWRTAWRAAGLPTGKEILAGPHNLRHTFARRLRLAGVPLETRKALLHHLDGDITVHYSPAEIRELIEAVEKLKETETTTLLRAVR
jgi:integrase